jgi:TFIIF-interacting CTD phosphatase-like protein
MRSIDEKSLNADHNQLTRKHPYYVWHLTKRFKSLNKMDKDLEAQESKYISLYCSDYIREAIDIAGNLREKSMSN